jgi:hypothetical protein
VTHHEWKWVLKNLSDETADGLYFTIEGDVPRAFPFLHFRVTDENGTGQRPIYVMEDHPLRKELYVLLRRAVKPRGRSRTFVIKYDWEEPGRKYLYNFQNRCEEFSLEIRLPKNQTTRPKAYWVDSKRGTDRLVPVAPIHKQGGKWQKLIWSISKVPAQSNLEFQW